jgi:hypothetical protein
MKNFLKSLSENNSPVPFALPIIIDNEKKQGKIRFAEPNSEFN